jgi:uncharacterized membrane protein
MRELRESIAIAAPVQTVWELLADFGNVSEWAPYMKTSHLIGEARSGIGMRRGMRHAWGFRFEEAVTHWSEGEGFSFDVFRAPFPMTDVKESWMVDHENGLSTVSTRVTYGMRLGFVGKTIDWLLVRFVVKREMRAGLRGLKQYSEAR